jgi:hypothetical protein
MIGPRAPELRFQLRERRDQRLGRVPPTEVAEPPEPFGLGPRWIKLHGLAACGCCHTVLLAVAGIIRVEHRRA